MDSDFRRNDDYDEAVATIVTPAKAGVQSGGAGLASLSDHSRRLGASLSCTDATSAMRLHSCEREERHAPHRRNVPKRMWEHKHGLVEGFTKKYRVKLLVWYEVHETMDAAITREKQIKEWRRAWKIRRIERANPAWRDLYEEICR